MLSYCLKCRKKTESKNTRVAKKKKRKEKKKINAFYKTVRFPVVNIKIYQRLRSKSCFLVIHLVKF